MPYIRVKKKREKSLARKLKHRLRGGNGTRPFSFYVYVLMAFIVALLVGMYLIRKAERIEPEQPVVSSSVSQLAGLPACQPDSSSAPLLYA
jgi:hypothetical protein